MPVSHLKSQLSMSTLDNQHFDTVIIGAGMAGMAAGIRLALAGKNAIILERHNASGGLNSFYSQSGRKFDVGLHAMTNFVPKGTKGTPLTKLLRQLRIPYDALDLCQQNGSRIAFPGAELEFSNDFDLFESEVARAFPKQVDGFRALAEEVRTLDAFNLGAIPTSAREAVQRHISDPLLEDMIFCPVMYYGSAEEHDMDYGQFSIMFRSLFFEGFARPFDGVRVIIKLLQDKYRSLGGIRKMKCGIKQIHTSNGKATAVELDNGAILTADKIISTPASLKPRACATTYPPTPRAIILASSASPKPSLCSISNPPSSAGTTPSSFSTPGSASTTQACKTTSSIRPVA